MRYCLEGSRFPLVRLWADYLVLWFSSKKRPGSDQEYPHLSLLFSVDAQASLDLLSAHLIKRTTYDATVVVNPYDNVQSATVTPPSMDPPSSYFIDGPQAACDASTKKLFLAYVAAHTARGVFVPPQSLSDEVLKYLALEGRTDDVDATEDDLDAWAALRSFRVLHRRGCALKEAAARSKRSVDHPPGVRGRGYQTRWRRRRASRRVEASEVAATIKASLAHADLE